jgi:hypothetical protein
MCSDPDVCVIVIGVFSSLSASKNEGEVSTFNLRLYDGNRKLFGGEMSSGSIENSKEFKYFWFTSVPIGLKAWNHYVGLQSS